MLRQDVDNLPEEIEEKPALHAQEIHGEKSSHATFPGRDCVFTETGEKLALHAQGIRGEESSHPTFPGRDKCVFADTGGKWALRTKAFARIQDEQSSHTFRGNNMEFVETERHPGLRTLGFGETEVEEMEDAAQSINSNGAETSSRKKRQDSLENASMNPEKLRAFATVGADIDEADKSERPKSSGDPRRFLRGNLKLSKLKWATFEEKPKKSLFNTGDSAKSMGSKEEIRLASLRRQRSKAVSFDEDFLEDLSEKTESMEESWSKYCRKNARRDSTCEEIEKTIFYQGYNLHKLRKAIVVRETLQERFTF